MGLLWSLRGVLSGRKGIRLLPRDVTMPIEYTFAVHDGYLDETDLEGNNAKTPQHVRLFEYDLK
jgi:hypothetical protein